MTETIIVERFASPEQWSYAKVRTNASCSRLNVRINYVRIVQCMASCRIAMLFLATGMAVYFRFHSGKLTQINHFLLGVLLTDDYLMTFLSSPMRAIFQS